MEIGNFLRSIRQKNKAANNGPKRQPALTYHIAPAQWHGLRRLLMCWAALNPMIYISALGILAFVVLSCQPPKEDAGNEMETLPTEEIEDTTSPSDTILERNDPSALNLTRSQLFIDTTRNSKFYENLINWDPNMDRDRTVERYLEIIKKDFTPARIDLKGFPAKWVTLKKLKGTFVLYDMCDGIDQRFEIRDSAFVFQGSHESDAESIVKLITLNKDKIELLLRTFEAKSSDLTSRVSIIKTGHKNVYILSYRNQAYDQKEYGTPIDKIDNSDMVVNHCVTMKMFEYDGFDEIKINKTLPNNRIKKMPPVRLAIACTER